MAAFVLLAFAPLRADQPDASYDCTPATFSGTATWYDNSPLGLSACHYSHPTLPGGTTMSQQYYAAVSTHMYDDNLCGACAEITENSSGQKVTVMITDECPAASNPTHCGPGSYHLDISQNAFDDLEPLGTGVFPITWKVVPCPAAFMNSKSQAGAFMTYQFKSGASSGWATLIIRDYPMPIETLQYCTGPGTGCANATWQRPYNGWVPPAGTWNTIYLRITDKGGNVGNFGPINCCTPQGTDVKDEPPAGGNDQSVWGNIPAPNMPGCGAAASPTRSPSRTPVLTPTISPTFTVTPDFLSRMVYDGETPNTNAAAEGAPAQYVYTYQGNGTNSSIADVASPLYAGTRSLGLRIATGAGGYAGAGWQFSPAAVDARTIDSSPFDTLEFYIRGNVGGELVGVKFGSASGTPVENANLIAIAPYVAGGVITTGWQLVSIPLSLFDLGLSGAAAWKATVGRMTFGADGATGAPGLFDFQVQVDNVQFVKRPSSPTPTISRTRTRTPTPTQTAATSPTYTRTASLTRTLTSTPSSSPTASPSRTFTVATSPTHTPTASASRTASSTRTFSFSPTIPSSPTASRTASETRTASLTRTFTYSPTAPSSPTASKTASETRTVSETRTPTFSPTPSRTRTPSQTFTVTRSETTGNTPSFTWSATTSRTATPTRTGTASATLTRTPTESRTATQTRTATTSRTFTFSPTQSRTATLAQSPTISETFTAVVGTATSSFTATRTDTRSPSPTRTATGTRSETSTFSETRTPTESRTLSNTRTETLTRTESRSPSETRTPAGTATPSRTPTEFLTPTASLTESPYAGSPTRTFSPSPSDTRTPTGTRTSTSSPSPSRTASESRTPTITRTPSSTATLTRSPTGTRTGTPTRTPTISRTDTPGPASSFTHSPSATPSATATASPSASPQASATNSPGPSLTFSPTPMGPTVSFLSLTQGPTAGGTVILIVGSNFAPGFSASLDGVPMLNLVFLNSTQVQAETPPGTAGLADLVFTNPGGLFFTMLNAFDYKDATPTPTFTAQVLDGPQEIEAHLAGPNPNPLWISAKLKGSVDSLTLKIYTKSLACVGVTTLRTLGPGWHHVPMPPEFSAAAGGLYHYHLSTERGGDKILKPGVGNFLILK